MLYGFLLLLECLLWGVGNPVMKIGLGVIPPLFCLSVRYILAFLIFMLFFAKRVFANMTRKHLAPYLIISAFTAASFIASAFALIYTTATNTGFLMSTAVIFTPFLSYLILKSKIEKKHILPIIIVTAGLYLLCSGGGRFDFGPGEFFALLCAISGAGMLVFSSKYLQEMDPLTTTVMQTGFAGLFCVIFALIFEDIPNLTEIPPVGWGVIIYLAIGCTCLAYLFQNMALRHVSATYVALAFCSEPIFTAIASWFLLGELLSAKGFIGAALIMASIIMASLSPEETQKPQTAHGAQEEPTAQEGGQSLQETQEEQLEI
ncbi:MAG TPA: DMT family transporter [Anaerovoracaceae bacterium]|nr:DMT family transporter [Anaerovoracaceae bacterium]